MANGAHRGSVDSAEGSDDLFEWEAGAEVVGGFRREPGGDR